MSDEQNKPIVGKEDISAESVDIKPVVDTEVTDTPPREAVEPPAKKEPIQVDTKPDELVDLDEFNAIKEDREPVKSKPPEPAKKDEKKPEIKEEPKVDDKKVELKQPDKATTDEKVDDKRDYNDLPESLRPIFKKLHNEPFNALKTIVKENEVNKTKLAEREAEVTKLKVGALPDNYYEHKLGYTLTPEFETAANNAIRAEQVARHWKGQLDRVRKGEATYQDINIDQRTGQIYLSDPMQVTATAEDKIAGYAEWAQEQFANVRSKMQTIAQTHESRHGEATAAITDFENSAFKNFLGEKAKEWEPIVKDTIDKTFPPAYRNSPLAKGYAKALITIRQMGSIIKHLQETGGKPPVKEEKTDDGKIISLEDKKKAGPNAGDLANAGGGSKDTKGDDVTFDDFKAVKES